MGGFFISGTDTNVGKTIVASIIVNKLDAIYYKPIQCGVDKKGYKDSDIIKKIVNNIPFGTKHIFLKIH